MSNKARQYKRITLRRLDTLSGNQCANPDCTKSLIAKDGETIVSKICHIEAASNGGPRFNPAMEDDEKRHYNNLILLCDECHRIIDNLENEKNYPVELLKKWKNEHETKIRFAIPSSNPSFLILAVNAISNKSLEEEIQNIENSGAVFKVEDKIKYNCIVRNRYLIDDYKIFYTKIAALYNELENQGSFKKEKLLRNIRKLYLKTKGKYVRNTDNSLQIIQANADNIIEDIEEELVNFCENYGSNSNEDISFGVSVIMVDAFMRCKIMEAPV